MKFETWFGLGGDLTVVKASRAYLSDTPTTTDFITPPELMEITIQGPVTSRLDAYFLAPQSGDYVFVTSGDDRGELWLGPDEEGLQLIYSLWHATAPRDWGDSATAPQRLEAGRFYLIRGIVMNGVGGGHLEIGVTLPDGEELRPIPVLGYLFEPPPTIHGCTNPTATNFNPLAEFDDGSCFGGRAVGATLDI